MIDSDGTTEPVVVETKVKVCGLSRREDALHAVDSGADYLGVVMVPGSPRYQTPEQARSILDGIRVPTVMVVADMDLSRILESAAGLGPSVIQLHGAESPELVSELRNRGSWDVWKAIRVRDQESVREGLERFGEMVQGLLLDTWHPERQGGTGIPFSWREVAWMRESVPEEMLLVVAGGLGPANVADAIRTLHPHVVDVSSGVEAKPGVKDPSRVEEFILKARAERAEKEL